MAALEQLRPEHLGKTVFVQGYFNTFGDSEISKESPLLEAKVLRIGGEVIELDVATIGALELPVKEPLSSYQLYASPEEFREELLRKGVYSAFELFRRDEITPEQVLQIADILGVSGEFEMMMLAGE